MPNVTFLFCHIQVPIITQGKYKSIVTRQEDFNLNGDYVLIKPIDLDQIEDQTDANTSYDLRVGCEYRDHRDLNKKELEKNGFIKLLPGSAVIIQSEECVHFSKNRFGQILPKVGLLQKGVSNTTSKIDPGYHGHLLITVFNLGKKTVILKRGEKFCSLVIHDVYPGARTYDKTSKRIEGRKNSSFVRNIRDFIEVNSSFIAVLSLLASIILAIIQFFSD